MGASATGRHVVMSVHPRFAEAIMDGRKKVEFRKRRLADDVMTALIENAQFCSPKVLTCVAPPMRAGLLRCWWSLTTHQLSEGDPLSHAHMGGRLGDTRPT